jgi:DNA repair protein RadC
MCKDAELAALICGRPVPADLDFARIASMDTVELAAVGIPPAAAARLAAAVELGRRTLVPRAPRPQLTTPRATWEYLVPTHSAHPVERFGVLTLTTKYYVIREHVISVGTIDGCGCLPRDVFRPALMDRAQAVVLFHNHPSGDPTPSAEDVSVTQRLVAAGALLSIDVIDHVILGGTGYYSFKEGGRL